MKKDTSIKNGIYQIILNLKLTDNFSEDQIWNIEIVPFLLKIKKSKRLSIKKNIMDIIAYSFTEILNNAIEHANANKINILFEINPKKKEVVFHISDDGVGLVNKLKKFLRVKDEREVFVHLTKGKITTDAKRHSGEGLFFVSKVIEKFYIYSHWYLFQRDNTADDWSLEKITSKTTGKAISIKGTKVSCLISLNSKIVLKSLFDKYTNLQSYDFDTTEILVKLSKFSDDTLMSRSEARRVLLHLEKFRKIIFDFKNIRSVGQGFVDEIFRVYHNSFPSIELIVKNANSDVTFMIERGKANI